MQKNNKITIKKLMATLDMSESGIKKSDKKIKR